MINAEVQKSGSESALSVIRKFSRRVQGTGLINSTRKRRYFERASSKAVQKKRALKRILRRENYRDLIKEGKVVEQSPRRGRSYRDPGTAAQSQQRSQTQTPTPRSSGLGESTPIAR